MKHIKVLAFIVTLFSLIFVFANISLAEEAVADYKEILQQMPGYAEAQKQYDAAIAQARSLLEIQMKTAKSEVEQRQLMSQYADFCKEQRSLAFDPLIGKMKYVLQQIAQERHYSRVSANNIGVSGVDITQLAIQRLNAGQTVSVNSKTAKLQPLKTENIPLTVGTELKSETLKTTMPATALENNVSGNGNNAEKTYTSPLPLSIEEKLVIAQREVNILRARVAQLEKEKSEGMFSGVSSEKSAKTVAKKQPDKKNVQETEGAVEVQFGAGYSKKIIQSEVDRATRLGIAGCYVAEGKDSRGRTVWRARTSVANHNDAKALCVRLTKLGFQNFVVQ